MMKQYILIIFLLIIGINARSQDVTFSQYFNTGMNINPAIVSTTDYFSFTGMYRQTQFIQDVTSNSTYLMLSRPLYHDQKRYGGFGFSILADKGGDDLPIRYEGANLAYAHNLAVTSNSFLSLGLQVGYFQRKLDYSDFETGSQWVDGAGYDETLGNGEIYDDLSASNLELSTGLFWYMPSEGQDYKAFAGVSVFNLTKPDYSFFGSGYEVPFRYIVHGGYQFYDKNTFTIMPQVLWYNSYHQNFYDVGVRWRYKFNGISNSKFIGKGSLDLYSFYHINRGIMLGLGIDQDRFAFGVSYDFGNFSDKEVPNRGTFEISFVVKNLIAPVSKVVAPKTNIAYVEREFIEKPRQEEKIVLVESEDVIERTEERQVKFELEQDFKFAFNAAQLDEAAKTYLNDLLLLLMDNKALKIEVIGHTDNVGAPAANQSISEKRANVVRDYLIEKGVASDRINAIGKADTEPLYDNNTSEGRSKNRRVEFIIYY